MKALKTFVSWLQIGLYDFSSFSVVFKEDLSENHQKCLADIADEAHSKGDNNNYNTSKNNYYGIYISYVCF